MSEPTLTGVTLNGLELDPSEISEREIQTVRREEEARGRGSGGCHWKVRHEAEDCGRVSKRARHWSKEEIAEENRRRFGIMSCPFKTQMENALWVIHEAGREGIFTGGIAKALNISNANASSLMYSLFKRLDRRCTEGRTEMLISQVMVRGQYVYRWISMKTLEAGLAAMRGVDKEIAVRAQAAAAIDALPKESPKPVEVSDVQAIVAQLVELIARDPRLKLTIVVEGK